MLNIKRKIMTRKNRTRKQFVVTLLFLMSLTVAQGQVSVGSDLINERAAILEVKSQEANADNVTSREGGLLLPRVALVNLATLEPFVSTTDIEWTDSTKKDALTSEHIGLEVYNTTTNGELTPGLYVWEGTKWNRLFRSAASAENNRVVFPLPAFNLPLVDPVNPNNTRLTVNLYQVYSNNIQANSFITNMPNKGDFITRNRYSADELDYVVTHYDKDIITIHNISNTGIMDYTVKNVNPGPLSFLNIYLVVHKGKEKN